MDNLSLKWQAAEYHHYKRSNDWFWAVGIIVISVATLAFFFHNVLFGILILLSAAILIYFVIREPQNVDYEINKRGVMVGKELHPYLTIESFWIETRAHDPKIIIKSKKTLMPYIIIPVHEESIDEIHNMLSKKLEEREMHEPASHKVMEYLGF